MLGVGRKNSVKNWSFEQTTEENSRQWMECSAAVGEELSELMRTLNVLKILSSDKKINPRPINVSGKLHGS